MQNEIEPFAWVDVMVEDGVEKETVFMKTKKGVELVIQESIQSLSTDSSLIFGYPSHEKY